MKIIVASKEKIDQLVADSFIDQIKEKHNSVLGLATGTTPIEIYGLLVKANKEGVISFKDVVTFNLDEYVGLDGSHHQSYRYFMNKYLFNNIDINKDNTHVLLGTGDYINYMNNYDNLIASYGGIDLQILGIGSDGHIAFNEPGTSFDSLTHIAILAPSTIKDNSRLFNNINEVPTKAVTMGLKSIMNAKKIVLVATGKNKAQAIYNLIKGEKSIDCPCTILRDHPDCTIYCDEEAYSLVK